MEALALLRREFFRLRQLKKRLTFFAAAGTVVFLHKKPPFFLLIRKYAERRGILYRTAPRFFGRTADGGTIRR